MVSSMHDICVKYGKGSAQMLEVPWALNESYVDPILWAHVGILAG